MRASLFDAGRIEVAPTRQAKQLVDHRFDSQVADDGQFVTYVGKGPPGRGQVDEWVAADGQAFASVEPDGAQPIDAYGMPAERGVTGVFAPIASLGGARVLEGVTAIGAAIYCPGEDALMVQAVILGADMETILESELRWVKRNPGVSRVELPLAGGRDLSLGAYIGIKFRGTAGVRALAGIWLSDPVPGSELPAPGGSEFVVLGSDVRTAAALLEGQPWTAPLEVGPDTYVRLALHAPALHRGKDGELPRVQFEVTANGATHSQTITLPTANPEGWHDVKLAVGAEDRDEVSIRLRVEDDLPGEAAVVLVGEPVVLAPRAEPATVLLITSDTHRADYVGMYQAGSDVSTPVLDQLARRGAYFVDCQTTTNITTPSHVAIMTGLHPRDTEVVDNSTRVTEEAATLAERFQAAGYRTFAAVSAGHLTDLNSGLGQGFDRFLNPRVAEQRADVATDQLAEWLDEAEGEDVFLWLHLFDAHAPYVPLEPVSLVSESRPATKITSEQLSGRGVPTWLRRLEVTGVDEVRGWYGEEVKALDHALASLLERPRMQQAWIALTSDHGENLGENGRTFEHSGLFQPVLQIPMVLAGPGVPVIRSEAQVQQFSVGRTLLDLAGIKAPFPGRNMLEMAAGELHDEPRYGLSSYGDQASISVGKWLLTLGLRTDVQHLRRPETIAGRVHLFDRTLGIKSEENFAEREPEVARKLHHALTTWLNSEPETPSLAQALAPSLRARLRLKALGYSGEATVHDSKWWDPERVTDPKWRAYW